MGDCRGDGTEPCGPRRSCPFGAWQEWRHRCSVEPHPGSCQGGCEAGAKNAPYPDCSWVSQQVLPGGRVRPHLSHPSPGRMHFCMHPRSGASLWALSYSPPPGTRPQRFLSTRQSIATKSTQSHVFPAHPPQPVAN